jgi:hypothetical protein
MLNPDRRRDLDYGLTAGGCVSGFAHGLNTDRFLRDEPVADTTRVFAALVKPSERIAQRRDTADGLGRGPDLSSRARPQSSKSRASAFLS